MPGRVVFDEAWLEGYNARQRAARLVPRVPASQGAPLAGRGGEPDASPVDSKNGCAAAPAVNAAPGRSGVATSSDAHLPRQPSNKYRAVRTEGIGPNGERRVYDSKAEARFARELNSERSAGLIVSWVPQVSFPLGPDEKGRDVRYRADALVILEVRPDGTFLGRFADKKGRDTPNSRTKRAACRALYSIDVKVI